MNTSSIITNTVQNLMQGPVGQSRQKAILTLAKRKNIKPDDARFYQAIRIGQTNARKQNG